MSGKTTEAEEARRKADRLLRSDKEESLEDLERTHRNLASEVEELQKEAQEKIKVKKKIKEVEELIARLKAGDS